MFFNNKVKTKYNKIVVNHQVFLTPNQRNNVYYGETVKVVGILTQYKVVDGLYPIKHNEVFCNYSICSKTDTLEFIECLPAEYRINLPAYDSEGKSTQYPDIDLVDILDKKQGGRESIFFEAMYTDSKKKIQGFHKIEIRDIKYFEKSLNFIKF
jgi:hypothetical protein